jgi:hypothetical protein
MQAESPVASPPVSDDSLTTDKENGARKEGGRHVAAPPSPFRPHHFVGPARP